MVIALPVGRRGGHHPLRLFHIAHGLLGHERSGAPSTRLVKIFELAFPLEITLPHVAHTSACLLLHSYPYSALLWTAKAKRGADGLETPAGVYHWDCRSGTAAPQ